MDKTGSRTPAHLGFNNQSSSSNSLPTNGHQRQRLWDMEANPSKVLHPSWDKKHRLPHQTPEAIFWRTSFWRSLCIMGVWGEQIWKGEHSYHPRLRQDSHLTQRDTGSSAAASPTHSIQHKRLQSSQGDHHRVLQGNGIILKDATTTELRPQHCKSAQNITRSSTNGHRRSLQQQMASRKRPRKDGPSERKRRASRQRIQQLLQ